MAVWRSVTFTSRHPSSGANTMNRLATPLRPTIELVRALDVQLIEAEGRRSERSKNPDAGDLVMRARARLYHGVSRANLAAAIQYYKEALQLAPDDVAAPAELADVRMAHASSGQRTQFMTCFFIRTNGCI
jgi:hypothetical protein